MRTNKTMIVRLSVLFLAADFFLPPLFGFKYNIFVLLFLGVMLNFCTTSFQTAIYGFVYSIIAELFFGYRFGTIAVPFLAVLVLIFCFNRFFSLGQFFSYLGFSDSLFYKTFSGASLFYILTVFIAIEQKLIYSSQLSWENTFLFLWDPVLLVTTILGALAASFLLSKQYRS